MKNLPAVADETTAITPAVQGLIDTIKAEMEQGIERARLAMEQEKKVTYWNVGKHIKEHLLQNGDRAEYGAALLVQLAGNLDIDKTTLYQSLQFYEEYPDIFRLSGKLTWTHVRTLLTVPEKEIRQELEAKIEDQNLSVNDLKNLIREKKGLPAIQAKETQAVIPLERVKPYVYKTKKVQNKVIVDLGFHFYIDSPVKNTKADIVIESEKKNDKYKLIPTDKYPVPHYTYQAYLLEVIDGDTLWVDIDLGFGTWTTQKIRLRGINSSEIQTPDGQTSKDYMQARLKGCQFIAIRTYWRDKFTRYLADVFYNKKESDFPALIQSGKYLNQELLDKGLAIRYVD